jgi:methionyl aminopeptidase
LEDTKKFIELKGENKEPLTEEEIDKFVYNSIIEQGAYPSPIGFMYFPKSVCVSVNECFVHGIPTTRPL